MRDTFVATLIKIAKENINIALLTGDLGFGVLKPYWVQLPNQFINVGIAEQNMLSVAAGMAIEGKTVVVYSIGNFPTLRALEQIRNDCAYHNADVKIVSVGGGFVYGALGMSHHASEDIAVLRALPNVCVVCPGDKHETARAVQIMMKTKGVFYLRLGRGGEPPIHQERLALEFGKAIKIGGQNTGREKLAIFSTGAILDEVCVAVALLRQLGVDVEQYSFPFVKPIDTEVIKECASKYPYIVTVEEHNILGGFGSAVAEVLAGLGQPTRLLRFGIDDHYCSEVGDQQYLRDINGISARKIATKIQKLAWKE